MLFVWFVWADHGGPSEISCKIEEPHNLSGVYRMDPPNKNNCGSLWFFLQHETGYPLDNICSHGHEFGWTILEQFFGRQRSPYVPVNMMSTRESMTCSIIELDAQYLNSFLQQRRTEQAFLPASASPAKLSRHQAKLAIPSAMSCSIHSTWTTLALRATPHRDLAQSSRAARAPCLRRCGWGRLVRFWTRCRMRGRPVPCDRPVIIRGIHLLHLGGCLWVGVKARGFWVDLPARLSDVRAEDVRGG